MSDNNFRLSQLSSDKRQKNFTFVLIGFLLTICTITFYPNKAQAVPVRFYDLSTYVRGLITQLRSDLNSIRDSSSGEIKSSKDAFVAGFTIRGNKIDFAGSDSFNGNEPQINFNRGGSRIYDNSQLRIGTDDYIYLDAPQTVIVQNNLSVGGNLCLQNDCRSSWSAISGVGGSGTTNRLARFTSTSILGDSQIIDTGSRIGIGITPSYFLQAKEGTTELWFRNDTSPRSGQRGLVLNKSSKAETTPHGMEFAIEGNIIWGYGMDFDTDNVNGRSDFVPVFDHTANGGTGADVFRVSAAADSSVGTGSKFAFGDQVGTPRNQTAFMLFDAGANLSGLSIAIDGTSAHHGLIINQQSASHNQATILLDQKWVVGNDVGASNTTHFSVFDSPNNTTRMIIRGEAGTNPLVGFGTLTPQGIVSAGGSNAVSMYNTVQTHFIGGYSNSTSNRSISIQQILDGSTAKQYFFLNGGLGAGSTATTPVVTSQFASTFGLESLDASLSVITAASGTNQTITRALTVLNSGNVGIGNTSPQSPLHVPDGKYAQFEDNNAGAPTSGDCDADTERGRLSIDTSSNRLYVCNGASRGWDFITLTD